LDVIVQKGELYRTTHKKLPASIKNNFIQKNLATDKKLNLQKNKETQMDTTTCIIPQYRGSARRPTNDM
jgi:hypothetical protein